MTKYVYMWDANNHWSDKKPVDEGYKLQANETFDVVPDGLNTPITRVTGGWKGATKEEHYAYVAEQRKLHPDQYPEQKPVGPLAEQQMIATLGQQQAKTDASVKQMQQMIAMLGSQMASSDAKEKANGGN